MNNKKIGDDFELEAINLLSIAGFWVHFITPNARGSQPFDIVAMKDGVSYAIDCKTNSTRKFSVLRLEDNQMCAFDKWLNSGGTEPMLFVKHDEHIYCVNYRALLKAGSINLETDFFARNTKMEGVLECAQKKL